jgi:hypothetical protein
MRTSSFIAIAIFLVAALLVAVPYIGLGNHDGFILYQHFGISLRQYLKGLLLLFFGLCYYQLLDISPEIRKAGWTAIGRSVWQKGTDAACGLFQNDTDRPSRTEWIQALPVAALLGLVAAVLISKTADQYRSFDDNHWHLAFFDYDLRWGTSALSLGGNLLNFFGIQVPLNSSLSPIIGSSLVLAPALGRISSVTLSVSLFFVAIAFLLWALGGMIKLRPLPRVVFAGTAALIVSVPYGVPLIPPEIFTRQAVLSGGYWLEVSILSFGAVFLFYLLGQRSTVLSNSVLGLGFAVLCYLVLLAFPAIALFSVPVIFFYVSVFLLTSRSAREFGYKAVVSGLLAAAMLLTNMPNFLINLYSYSYGVYLPLNPPWVEQASWHLLRSSAAFFSFYGDLRVIFLFAVSFATMIFLSARSSGALQRFAIAGLVCELGIIVLSIASALFRADIFWYYAEQIHQPLLIAFFVLFFLVALMIPVRRIAEILRTVQERTKGRGLLGLAACNPGKVWFAVSLIGMLSYLLHVPTSSPPTSSLYPPQQPISIKLLADEVALAPGQLFRGRVLTVVGMRSHEALGWARWWVGSEAAVEVLHRYGHYFGNDHWLDLLFFDIPIVNGGYGHWISPTTYLLLKDFFGQKQDASTKSYLVLRAFHERMAQMLGIRMVVTDAASVPGATLIYRTTAGDVPLSLFRMNHVNLGQYSPTRLLPISTGAEALMAMASNSFDPERDALIEEKLEIPLVPATLTSLTTNFGPTLSLEAQSSGSSLLVLPFEYSHCLRLVPKDGTSAQMLPVNLQQIGILFERQLRADISYQFGPLAQPQCRGQDRDRADKLRLKDAFDSDYSFGSPL